MTNKKFAVFGGENCQACLALSSTLKYSKRVAYYAQRWDEELERWVFPAIFMTKDTKRAYTRYGVPILVPKEGATPYMTRESGASRWKLNPDYKEVQE